MYGVIGVRLSLLQLQRCIKVARHQSRTWVSRGACGALLRCSAPVCRFTYPSHDREHASHERAVRSASAPVGHAAAQRCAAWSKPPERGPPNGPATAPSKPRPIAARPSSSPAAAAMRTQASQLMHRSEEHRSELQSPCNLVCRLLREKKNRSLTTDHYDACHVRGCAPPNLDP